MKYKIVLFFLFGFGLCGCKKHSSKTVTGLPELNGTLTSVDYYELGEPTMYIYHQDPTTDQALIDDFLQRHQINDFVFRITQTSVDTPVSIDATSSTLRFQVGNDRSFQAMPQISTGYHLLNPYVDKGDTIIELRVLDTITVNGSFYSSHCEMTNYNVSMIPPSSHGAINNQPAYYSTTFPLQYINGRWVLHIMTSFITENDSSGTCSSLLKDYWGIDRVKYIYPEHDDPFTVGDTVVMQSKDLYFTQNQ